MHTTRLGLLLAPWFPLLMSAAVGAQVYGMGADGALAPTTNITLDTTPNGGVFEFTSINIPAGVTVRLAGNNPAILLCLGSVTIAGRLDAVASTRRRDSVRPVVPGAMRAPASGSRARAPVVAPPAM